MIVVDIKISQQFFYGNMRVVENQLYSVRKLQIINRDLGLDRSFFVVDLSYCQKAGANRSIDPEAVVVSTASALCEKFAMQL